MPFHINHIKKQGGSIGSALAILTFYPLERIRVETQSQQQQKKPQKSTNRGATTKKENADNPTQETYNQADESKQETILLCLIRLHKEKSLYRGAKNMALTLMISNFIFFYALQVKVPTSEEKGGNFLERVSFGETIS